MRGGGASLPSGASPGDSTQQVWLRVPGCSILGEKLALAYWAAASSSSSGLEALGRGSRGPMSSWILL